MPLYFETKAKLLSILLIAMKISNSCLAVENKMGRHAKLRVVLTNCRQKGITLKTKELLSAINYLTVCPSCLFKNK